MILTEAQRAAASALGLDPNTMTQPCDDTAEPPRVSRRTGAVEFTDAEWIVIEESGVLPPEAAQLETMSLRVFVGAVVAVVSEARQWTDLDELISCEAVRKRFSRYARAGIWQRMAEALQVGQLSSRRQEQFAALAKRAELLCRHHS